MRDSKAAPQLHVAMVPPLVAEEGPALSPLSQDLEDEVHSSPSRKTRLDKGKGRLYSPRIVVSEYVRYTISGGNNAQYLCRSMRSPPILRDKLSLTTMEYLKIASPLVFRLR